MALVVVACSANSFAQIPPRRAALLVGNVPPVAAVAGGSAATELTIRWVAADAPADEPIPARDFRPVNQFEVVARRSVMPGFVRERAPQLSRERLVVVAVDATGREVAWQQVADPRIVLSESAGPGLELSGQTLYRPLTELVVALPDALATAAIRVYEARWTGSEFVLDGLGEIAVGAR